MPAFAHIGIGFAAKRVLPEWNVLLLILAAEFIEILFIILWSLGIEHPPTDAGPPFSPWTHSLMMGVAWSVLGGMLVWVLTKNVTTGVLISLVIFSHPLLDFIASPKTAFYPSDTGMPLFADYSSTYGLGLWNNATIAWTGETGILAGGILIYLLTLRRFRTGRNVNNPV